MEEVHVNWRSIDTLRWRSLIPASITGAVLAIVGILLVPPQVAAPQTVCCVGCSGNSCGSECTKECSDGSCCKWVYYHKKTAADTIGEEDPEG
jgi:hypothetical protein